MNKNHTWLICSLFCPVSEWPDLLKKGIKPFIDLIVRENKVTSFRIEINYISGENLRLGLQTVKDNAEALALTTDSFFKSYFSKRNSAEFQILLPIKGIFMPFPINTIQYGLYRIDQVTEQESDFMTEFSLIIIDFFREETFDDETILLLAFYLHISCLKITSGFTKAGGRYILDLYNLPEIEEMSLAKELAKEKYAENEMTLLEIVADIFFDRNQEDSALAWLKKWEIICCKWIKQMINTEADSTLAIDEIHKKIYFTINNQLGINGDMLFILFWFIQQSVSKFLAETFKEKEVEV